METIKRFFIELDLFSQHLANNSEEDVFRKRLNLIATRVYIVLLFFILFIIATSWSLVENIEQIDVQLPSLIEYESLPSDSLCPCTEYSVPYSVFLTSEPSFHQICSSIFVSDTWISSFYFGTQQGSFDNHDFRTIGFSFFQTLAMFCRHSQIQVNDILTSLNSNSLIIFNLLSRMNFREQIFADINQFKTNALQMFKTQIYTINQLIAGSFLINSLRTSLVPVAFYPIDYGFIIEAEAVRLSQEDGSYCNCTASLTCESAKIEISALNNTLSNVSFVIPGMKLRCMPVDTCLHSTLECFFNQTCLDILLSYMSIMLNYTAMNLTQSSRFHINTTIETLAFDLMIEDWNFNMTYEKYFEKCAPKSCSFTTAIRNTAYYIGIKLIGILSGLCIVLRILMTIIIQVVEYMHKRRTGQRQIQSFQTRIETIRSIWRSLSQIIIQFNLFKDTRRVVEDQQIHRQQIATRLYLTLFVIIMCIFAFYTGLSRKLITNIVNNPSELVYVKLSSSYSSSLHCQCSQISIDYQTFINIQPIFHPVCSSDLVSIDWIGLLRENYRLLFFEVPDLFYLGAGLFQFLVIFCETANTTIYDSLGTFLRRQIITTEVLSEDQLKNQLTKLIDQWRSGVTHDVLQIINLFRANMQGNMLLSNSYNFQWYGRMHGYIEMYFSLFLPDPKTIESCTCALSPYCGQPLPLRDNINRSIDFPGFIVACTPITSLMRSDLQAFYNQSFIDELSTYFVFNSKNFSLNSLVISNATQINTTIQTIADHSFVNDWLNEISFEKYYKTCLPSSCTYQIMQRPNLISIVLSIITISGGLLTLLKIIVQIALVTVQKFQGQLSQRVIKTWFINFIDRYHLSKRLNVILIITTVTGLYFSYTLKQYQQVEEVAKQPSLEHYFELVQRYSNGSLICPCSQASITYESFINLSVTRYHEICSKEFLTYEWLQENIPPRTPLVIDPSTYIDVIPSYIQLIYEFCQLAQQTVNTNLMTFLTTALIEATPNPSIDNFQRLMESRIENFKNQLSLSLLRSLELLREITHINQLATIFRGNWRFLPVNQTTEITDSGGRKAVMIPVLYDNCNCALSKQCMKPMTDSYDSVIPGLMIGCYVVEALLQSSFECFYNESCFITITDTYYYHIDVSALILDASISSRYNSKTKIEQILESLFIEDWSSNISYDEYYKVCSPSSCSFYHQQSAPFIEIVQNLLGIYGGLTIIVANCVVPLLIQLGYYLKNRSFRRVHNIDR